MVARAKGEPPDRPVVRLAHRKPHQDVPGATHRSLRDVVTGELRGAILAGRLRPGDRLIEDKLAAEFGVSRNPVRESLRVLESEGLVVVMPRRGAVVASLTREEAHEVIELRASLEGLCARLAARRGSPGLRQACQETLARGRGATRAGKKDVLVQLNDEFHELVATAGANRYLTEFMRSLRAKTYWLFSNQVVSRAEESWQEHAAIMEAIIDGDEDMAALLASRHVERVGMLYLEDTGSTQADSA